ncbi:FixH family protein [Lederbergia graminis]|uniref:FixH family protein n=1 Tax=Lederbergia graminis TaxID=735518 RepID=A0ABW0LJY1_9BACI
MKNIRISIIAMFTVALLLSACSAEKSDADAEVAAEIMIPSRIDVNTETELSVKVVQGSTAVDDANDVQFEIWTANSDDSELITAKHSKDGKYAIHISFADEGLYYVQTHITARGTHIMPTKAFIVGTATKEQLNELEKYNQQQDTPNIPNGEHSHH